MFLDGLDVFLYLFLLLFEGSVFEVDAELSCEQEEDGGADEGEEPESFWLRFCWVLVFYGEHDLLILADVV